MTYKEMEALLKEMEDMSIEEFVAFINSLNL